MDAVVVTNLGKAYRQYHSRWSRLLEWVWPFGKARHERKWVLRDITFRVSSGHAVGIIGINGAGKSTLLKLITGTTQPTLGSVHMQGRVAALLELGMGFHPDFTGRQNVVMAAQLLGLHEDEVNLHMAEIESFAEIGGYIDQPVRVYSSGMQVRLAFAVATAVRPDILIVDEALSVGDGYFQHKCFARIRMFQEKGSTLLFVSHDPAVVRSLCDQAIWLDNGRIREAGETKTVLDSYAKSIYAKDQEVEIGTTHRPVMSNIPNPQMKRDCRLDFINNTNLRNDIEIFQFNQDAVSWGDGKAKITSTQLQDLNGTPLSWIVGGEEVVLAIEALAIEELKSVIVGFMVRDRLGQNLFGDNTYITTFDEPIAVESNYLFRGSFRFYMPLLPVGTYAITAAVAGGTQKNHVVHHWIHDAVYFESHNVTGVNGLIGVPMQSIKIENANVISRDHVQNPTPATSI